MQQLDIEETAKVIFFNPEITAEVLSGINKSHIFVDKQIEDRISLYKTQMLGEIDNPQYLSYLEENIAMLENLLNELQKSHL